MGWGCGSKCRHCEVITIHRFVHQSACHESSGHVSTFKNQDFSARVFLDIIPKVRIHNIIEILSQKWAVAVMGRRGHRAGTGFGKGGDGAGMGWGSGMGGGVGDGDGGAPIYINPILMCTNPD